ncbi:hypothetical protein MMC30_008868 [Trapelia coarctata]|nr:hypothetical protein [Trapelia coarctata]
MTRGAGGFSIHPGLSYSRIVPSDSPAFALLDAFADNICSTQELQEWFDKLLRQLSTLYSERKASPHDVDQYGHTALHKACQIFLESIGYIEGEWLLIYSQFLRRLQGLGVPINKVDFEGGTCVTSLLQLYSGPNNSSVTSLCEKMLDLGAQLSPFSGDIMGRGIANAYSVAGEFAKCGDIAEAAGCNDVFLAVLAKSEHLLRQAIERSPHQVNEPNAIGQTALHLSIDWPKGMRILIDANAHVDAPDYRGYTPIFYAAFRHAHVSMCILQEADCCLSILSRQSRGPFHDVCPDNNLLRFVTRLERSRLSFWGDPQESIEDVKLTVDMTISLLAKRLRSLEDLAVKFLPYPSIQELGIAPGRLLDSKSEKAIEMLERRKVLVPQALRVTELGGESVYHDDALNLRQAQLLWQNGFRKIDELNSLGTSPLMCVRHSAIKNLEEELELVGWFLSNGASLHQLQQNAFRCKNWHTQLTEVKSSISNVHYLGKRLGMHGLSTPDTLRAEPVQWSHGSLEGCYSLNVHSIHLVRDILTDTLRDSCQCACSLSGCLALTQMLKLSGHWMNMFTSRHFHMSRFSNKSRAALVNTYCAAFLLDIDRRPELAWFRFELFRFNIFTELKLRHTCCQPALYKTNKTVIVELGDEEDRPEIRLEQEEQVSRMEELILEFENKYQEMGIPLIDFFEGYWRQKMAMVLEEQHEVDTAKLTEIGVVQHDDDDARVKRQIMRMEGRRF